ncbi:MAG: hypothetical protein ABIG31_05275 [Candidatus Omnitrophota bacterium]
MNTNSFHPGTAAILSFIFNGLGQLYNGQLFKGLAVIFISFVNILVFLVGSILIAFWLLGKTVSANALCWGLSLFFIGLISIALLGIYSIVDAYRTAAKK